MVNRLIVMYLGFMLFPFYGISQETRILILDKISNEPIGYANIVVSSLDNNNILAGYVSNEKGEVVVDIDDKSIIRLSYVGFLDYNDTIYPGIDKTIYLKSVSYNVDEVVVTGQYSAATQDKSIYKVSVLNSREIEQRAAVNIKEMLSAELNIRTTHDGALGSSLTMQGLGGEHIKILVDGVPVIGRENGNIDLDQINLQNVDHIEVISGPMSVVYGSNALAGVINIITKSPDRIRFSSFVDMYYESVGVYNINAGVSGNLKRNSFSVVGGRNFFDGYQAPGSTWAQRWKPKEQWNFTGDYKYVWDKAFIKLGATWFNQELRDNGLPLLPYNETRIDKIFYTQRLVLRADFKYELSKKSRINSTGSFSGYRKVKNTYLKDLTTLERYPTPGEQDTTWFENIMLRSDYSFGDEASVIGFQAGIDLNNEIGFGKRIKDNEQQIGDYAIYMNLNYSPINVIDIQPGLRFIYNTKFHAPIIYSLNAKYNISEKFIVRASIASGFRAPSLKELYLEFVDVNHDIHGNENLKAETSINANLLLQYNSKLGKAYDWGAELNLFNNSISDNIQLIPFSGNTNYYTYVNVNKFISRGTELSFNNKIYPWITLKFGVAIIGKKIDYSGSSDAEFEYYSDFNASFVYLFKKYDINLSVYYKYNGKSPQLMFVSTDEDPVLGYLAAYQTLDINISKWFWQRRVNVQVGGKNLFDNTNIDITGGQSGGIHSGGDSESVNWGRTFFVRLQFKLNK